MEEKAEKKKPVSDKNEILVGKKDTKNYVLAALTLFNTGSKEVMVKARGRAISKAVDVAEILKNKFLTDVRIENVEIGTEEVQNEDGTKLNVSTIQIKLKK